MTAGGTDHTWKMHLYPMESVLQGAGADGYQSLHAPDRHTMLLQTPEEAEESTSGWRQRYIPDSPTDLQSPLMAAACVARGRLILRERIFSGDLKSSKNCAGLGARIPISDTKDCAVIEGGRLLEGRNVIARGAAWRCGALIAGLAADGITTVSDTIYIQAGI